MKRFALLTLQGTACPETVLTENEYTAENRSKIEREYCIDGNDTPCRGTWTDVTDNDACDAGEYPIKNQLLLHFISATSWDRGHSAGESEVEAIALGLRYDLQKVDDYITLLEGCIDRVTLNLIKTQFIKD